MDIRIRGFSFAILSMLVLGLSACAPGGGGSASAPAPAITSAFGGDVAAVVQSDGQVFVATVSATHPEPGELLSFSIDGGADAAAFTIDALTGILSFAVAPTFATPTDADSDNVYEVTVVVTDSSGATDTQTFSVSVAFAVDTLADVVDGDLTAGSRSLREAIDFVLAGESVTFVPALSGGTITLAGGALTIDKSLRIDGDLNNDGTPDITIDANALSRVFDVDDGGASDAEVRLSGLHLVNGRTTTNPAPGGAIRNVEDLTLVDCVVRDSATTGADSDGGGIANESGRLTLEGVQVVGNSTSGSGADGGGVFSLGGELTVTSSVIAQNRTTGSNSGGGGIRSTQGTLSIRDSDIDDNLAERRGGGIHTDRGSYTIERSTIRNNETNDPFTNGGGLYSVTNSSNDRGTIIGSTIHSNRVDGDGGGIYIVFNRVEIFNSTITSNFADQRGDGIHATEFDPDFGSRLELTSTIVASNGNEDLFHSTAFTGQNPFTSGGGNLVGVGIGTAAFGAAEVIGNADPQLAPIDFYGGPTPTRPPLAASPAIGAGNNVRGLTTDQRGAVRTFGGSTDVGAVERNDGD